MSNFNEKTYKLPEQKVSMADVVEWLRKEFSEAELSDIIIEILAYGDGVWDTVSKAVIENM